MSFHRPAEILQPFSLMDDPQMPLEGVRSLDHTADVGLEIRAPDLGELIRRAALGMDRLLREAPPPRAVEDRRLRVEAADPPALLRACLRELLFLHELEGFTAVDLRVRSVSATLFEADVSGGYPAEDPIREIKGVTWHLLSAEPVEGGWAGHVIFDV